MDAWVTFGLIAFWILGYLSHVAFLDANKDLLPEESREALKSWLPWVLLFFVWPYLMLYGRAKRR